ELSHRGRDAGCPEGKKFLRDLLSYRDAARREHSESGRVRQSAEGETSLEGRIFPSRPAIGHSEQRTGTVRSPVPVQTQEAFLPSSLFATPMLLPGRSRQE